MKKYKNRKRLIIVMVLVLLATGVLAPAALSYFNSLQKQGISIRATPASEIWEISGSFDENRWAQNNHTGIFIKNKCRKDLWMSFEYGGELQQVFKQSNPVLLPTGTTLEIVLQPLDDADSPRILNPLDLIDCRGMQAGTKSGLNCGCILNCRWKTFSGQFTIHILNEYASLASGPVQVSGDTLWYVFFSRKFGLNPLTYYERCWDEGILEPRMKRSQTTRISLQGAQLEQAAGRNQAEARDFTQEWEQYQPIALLQPVMQVVEKVAPGLLEERSYFIGTLRKFQLKLESFSAMIDDFQAQEKNLHQQIESQQDLITNLTNHIYEMEKLNQNLQQQINVLSTPHLPIAPPGGPAGNITEGSDSGVPELQPSNPDESVSTGSDSGSAEPGAAEPTENGAGSAESGSSSSDNSALLPEIPASNCDSLS